MYNYSILGIQKGMENPMKKTTLAILVLLLIITAVNYTKTSGFEEEKIINPLTGTVAENADLLSNPPMLIPYARFTPEFRPSAGLSFAPWVFEMHAGGGESRPMALFYGSLPQSTAGIVPTVGSISAAVLGTESLRNQYLAVLVTAGNPQYVVEAGLKNLENWYGESGADKYPVLPVSRMTGFMEKWKKRLVEPDVAGLQIPFSSAIPTNGKAGNSLLVRYADFNQVFWEFSRTDGLYHRSTNSPIDDELVEEYDILNNEPIAVQNLIILFADHTLVDDEKNFTVNFNYVNQNPALIFRDGLCYQAYWTTRSETYERETEKLRPIRFLDSENNVFNLKPGKSWVHVVQINNPVNEVAAGSGSETQNGSGNWILPYISPTPLDEISSEGILSDLP